MEITTEILFNTRSIYDDEFKFLYKKFKEKNDFVDINLTIYGSYMDYDSEYGNIVYVYYINLGSEYYFYESDYCLNDLFTIYEFRFIKINVFPGVIK